jgi:aspartokinase
LEDRGYEVKINDISKLSIIGYGVIQDNQTLEKVLEILNDKAEILDINLTQSKIEIIAKNIDDNIVNELHKKLIETT